jgi:hypothetical protein
LEAEYPDRFEFYPIDTRDWQVVVDLLEETHSFELMFIDADHNYEGVVADTKIGMALQIPYLLYDNYESAVSRCVHERVLKGDLSILEQFNPELKDSRLMVLCKNETI